MNVDRGKALYETLRKGREERRKQAPQPTHRPAFDHDVGRPLGSEVIDHDGCGVMAVQRGELVAHGLDPLPEQAVLVLRKVAAEGRPLVEHASHLEVGPGRIGDKRSLEEDACRRRARLHHGHDARPHRLVFGAPLLGKVACGGGGMLANTAQGNDAQAGQDLLRHIDADGVLLHDELGRVDVDELELVGLVQHVVGNQLGGHLYAERGHVVAFVLEVGHQQGRIDVDTGSQQLLGVLVTHAVARADGVHLGKAAKDRHVRASFEDAVHVERLRGPRLGRRLGTLGLDQKDVAPTRRKPLGLVDHGGRGPRAAGVGKEQLEGAVRRR